MLKRLFIAIVLGTLSAAATAQTASDAIVAGTVSDPSGRLIENASVTVRNVATGIVTRVATNKSGQYRTPPLRIGEYTLRIESSGFRQFNESEIILDIGSVSQIDATLEVGETQDTVEVRAGTEELLQKSDSSVGTVITNQAIEELPLNGGSSGRDYLQLATLSPGTTPAVPTSTGNGGGISIGGQPGAQAAFLLDGIDNNNQQILTAHTGQKEVIKPSIDAISEFKVETTSYSAEYGRSSSGVVSVDLKSGTNNIHGSAFEFIRNDAVDALPDFSATKLPFKYNDFGGTLGAPVRRDRAFLFGDLEFFRLRTQTTAYSLVPTAQQKAGQFATPVTSPTHTTAPLGRPFRITRSRAALIQSRRVSYSTFPHQILRGAEDLRRITTSSIKVETRITIDGISAPTKHSTAIKVSLSDIARNRFATHCLVRFLL
jgi:hypothetical protein